MIKEVLLVHHTHTDIGYTHPQPAVFELHHRFIEMALDLADASAGERNDARFRWTCEVTGTTRAWWERASASDQDRFLAAVRRGQIEVAALEWHLTPLADVRMIVRSLRNVAFFRSLGIPVRSAMNTDVNGVPWGLVDVLLDHDIDGFSMSSNSHFGAPVTPRPGAFRWASPGGRKLTVWNGFQYWHAANVKMRMPLSVEEVAAAMPPFLAEAERRGYTLPFIPVQITNPHHPDNATPDSTLSAFVRDWNDTQPEVRLRTVLLSEVFERLRQEELPVLSGDWTDYWNFGAGSSSRETTVLMEGLRTLDAAQSAAAWPASGERREAEHLNAAHDNLALYAEHTWGADCSIGLPESIETKLQWSIKSAFAYQGLAHARIVLRDRLHDLAVAAGGDEPTFLLYNPSATPFRGPVRLPIKGLEWPLTVGVHHRQRLDGALGNLPDDHWGWFHIELPGLAYRTMPLASLTPLSGGLTAEPSRLASDRVQIAFDTEVGGVTSLLVDGIEYAGSTEDFKYGVPVLERPASGDRRSIMRLDFDRFEPAEGWQLNWARDVFPGRLVETTSAQGSGVVEHRQVFSLANDDRLEVVYRLFPGEASLDVEAILGSAGDDKPYSLALPFVLPGGGETAWHFDTAGALVEFDREQLPNAARHYVTARRFVRMATETQGLTISTPDLPLWKFGGMFFTQSSELDAAARRPVTLAWLSNNYWEVNFLANQSGRTTYRFRLFPHGPEPVADSYMRVLPHAVPPRLHAFRESGPVQKTGGELLRIEGEHVLLDSITHEKGSVLLTLMNLAETPNRVRLAPGELTWKHVFLARLDGEILEEVSEEIELAPRAIVAVKLQAE